MTGIELSISAMAQEFQIDRATVRKRLKAANVQPSGERGGYPVYTLRSVIPALGNGTTQDLDKMTPFERKAFVASQRDELKLQTERGELIPIEEHRDGIHALSRIVVRALVTLPDKLERDLRISPAIVEYVDKCIGILRDEMAASVLASCGDD